ncbi:unnamed protein product [[Actinomadura] parvosata subsp. kistnae]|uniref:Uncharacterized protein n=1 Tax=Nonomuraea composti TaxID=2720023 RepID=A0ABX1BHM9_9ACTN|nr:hypothetical protein [Nonomuraea sp. FMUSA5-5]NJP95992.1 hypothetical protein [Nonomuraea sp. FMUSA5-5]SPL88331.1 unnamed protein product [Actinomadura parvosata subsp. kistnae]
MMDTAQPIDGADTGISMSEVSRLRADLDAEATASAITWGVEKASGK